MVAFANRVKVSCLTQGLGDLVLSQTLPTFFGIERLSDQGLYEYEVTDGVNSEVGRGTWSASQSKLSRGCIQSTQNDQTLYLSGSSIVIITVLASTLSTLNSIGGVYNTYADLAAGRPVPGSLLIARLGYYAPGDGGDVLLRFFGSSPPNYPGWQQDANGNYWVYLVSRPVPEQFGAACNGGASDDTPGFVAAVAYAIGAGLGKMFINQKDYWLNTAANIALDSITIEGCGTLAGSPNSLTEPVSRFMLTSTAASPFALNNNVSFLGGCTFLWPNQTCNGPIVSYPALFDGTNAIRFQFDKGAVMNAFRFLQINDSGVKRSGGHRITSSNIFAMDAVFDLYNGTTTTMFIDDVWCSSAVAADINNVAPYAISTYAAQNGAFFRFNIGAATRSKIAGLKIQNCVCYGLQYGVHGISGSMGVTSIDLEVDGTAQMIKIENGADIDGVSWIGSTGYCYQFLAGPSGPIDPTGKAHAVEVLTTSGISNLVNLSGVNIYYAQGDAVHLNGQVNNFTMNGGVLKSFGETGDNTVTQACAVYINSAITSALMTGVSVEADKSIATGVVFDDVANALITGNQFSDCGGVVTVNGGTDVRVGLNQETTTRGPILVNNTNDTSALVALSNDWNKGLTPTFFPSFSAKPTGGQTFVGGAEGPITFATLVADGCGEFNLSTGIYTAGVRGKRTFKIAIGYATGTGKDLWAFKLTTSDGQLFQISSTVPSAGGAGSTVGAFVFNTDIQLAPGVTVTPSIVRSNGTGNLTLQTNAAFLIYQCDLVNLGS